MAIWTPKINQLCYSIFTKFYDYCEFLSASFPEVPFYQSYNNVLQYNPDQLLLKLDLASAYAFKSTSANIENQLSFTLGGRTGQKSKKEAQGVARMQIQYWPVPLLLSEYPQAIKYFEECLQFIHASKVENFPLAALSYNKLWFINLEVIYYQQALHFLSLDNDSAKISQGSVYPFPGKFLDDIRYYFKEGTPQNIKKQLLAIINVYNIELREMEEKICGKDDAER